MQSYKNKWIKIFCGVTLAKSVKMFYYIVSMTVPCVILLK